MAKTLNKFQCSDAFLILNNSRAGVTLLAIGDVRGCLDVLSSQLAVSQTQLLLQFQFGICACMRACARSDLSGPYLLHLCTNFEIIWLSCSSSRIEVLFETLFSGRFKVKVTLKGQMIKWS